MTLLPGVVLAAAALIPSPPPNPPPDPLAKPASPCPSWLTAWTFSGTLEAGDGFTADLLEVRGDRARITELTIRSQSPRLPAAETDWFWPEPWPPEPASFSVAARPIADKPLDDLCRALLRTGLGAVIGRSKSELTAVEGSYTIVSKTAAATLDEPEGHTGVEVRPPDPRPPERLPPIPWEEGAKLPPGTIVQPGIVATTKASVDRRDVTARQADPAKPDDPAVTAEDDAERKALSATRDVIVRAARALHFTSADLVDVPTARRMIARLRELDLLALPKALPSEFLLTVAAAPRDYVIALAEATLTEDESPDRLPALRELGDQPAPDAVEDLLLIVRRRPDATAFQKETALALRALLKAAPDQARMQALSLLTGPRRVARAAMGVFYFTEPSLRRELVLVDFNNPERVRAMAARIRGHLTANAKDPELKKAAAGVQPPG